MSTNLLLAALLSLPTGRAAAHPHPALEQLLGAAGSAAPSVPAGIPSALPRNLSAADGDVIMSVWETMMSGMAADRRAFVKDRVLFFKVAPGVRLADEVASTLNGLLPPADATREIAGFNAGYAWRMAQSPIVPRGFTGGYDFPGGAYVLCFIGEENLTAPGEWDENGNRALRVAVHELGHAVFRMVTKAERAEMRDLAAAYYVPDASGAGGYREGDEDELFAMASEIWFGVHQLGPNKKGWPADTPWDKLAGTMRFIERVYGPARNVR